ncbi:thiamine phosphate synthase, partial [Methylobacterium trifolii]
MADPQRLTLLSPHGVGADTVDALADALRAACAGGDVAAVILRLAPGDER